MKHFFDTPGDYRIIDGGFATELECRGNVFTSSLWNAGLLVTNPHAIQLLHYDYYRAGADVAITSSYQVSYEGFKKEFNLSPAEVDQLLRKSVQLAKNARDQFYAEELARGGKRPRPLVAASVGPYGAVLAGGQEYNGNYGGASLQDLKDFHRPRIAALLSAEPDLLAFETIPTRVEVQALLQLLHEFKGAYAWFSFTCDETSNVRGERISHGERFEEIAAELEGNDQIVAIGVNCCRPETVTFASRNLRKGWSGRLLCYPNSGEDWNAETRCYERGEENEKERQLFYESKEKIAAFVAAWREAGVSMIGGCCRTTPAFIQKLASIVRPDS